MLRIGIAAGEPSGDFLAAHLVGEIRKHRPDLEVEGVGGQKLREAGCNILFPMEKLAVMGLVEALGSLPELLGIRRKIARHFTRNPPDIFIGVDAPDFNLGLESNLRKTGIKTIHYVSPAVWAWRGYRVKKLRRAADLVLSVFPFEQDFLREHNIRARYAGHPLAAQTGEAPDKAAARRRLGISPDRLTVAILPGSRKSELDQLMRPFMDTAAWLRARLDNIQFVSNAPDEVLEERLLALAQGCDAGELRLKVVHNRMADVLTAADVALLASGTVTLEAMLHRVPMVVAYRMHGLTFRIVRALVRLDFVSLPNLLARRRLVPEFFQSDCRAEILGPAVRDWLRRPDEVRALSRHFAELHASLRPRPGEDAATLVLEEIG